jgi:hypothetical protein
MAAGLLSPLQLTAGAGLLQNQGLVTNTEFVTVATEYENIPFIADLLTTLANASSGGLTASTILRLEQLGNVACPALGDSIPNGYTGAVLTPSIEGFVGNLPTGSSYVSNVSKFVQAFAAVEGYISLINTFINSAVQANEYLGPTFTNLDDMITADLSKVSSDLPAFGNDLTKLGFLFSLSNIQNLGEPAALLQQLSAQGNMGNSTLPCVETALRMTGLNDKEIADLISDNRQSLFNPNGLSENQFNRLQQRAYQAMTMVSGDCLADVLAILDVTVPNIDDMSDLLDPTKIFPTSYPRLTFDGLPIYQGDAVAPDLASVLNAGTVTGCDELGKIIPPAQAVVAKALQSQLQQVSGINNLTLPELALLLV